MTSPSYPLLQFKIGGIEVDRGKVWVLDRLLPGQRAGTKEWSLFLKEVVEREGYETFQLSPNLYVKKSVKGDVEGAILVHVDDIQLAATPTEGQRLKARLEARLTTKDLADLVERRSQRTS